MTGTTGAAVTVGVATGAIAPMLGATGSPCITATSPCIGLPMRAKSKPQAPAMSAVPAMAPATTRLTRRLRTPTGQSAVRTVPSLRL